MPPFLVFIHVTDLDESTSIDHTLYQASPLDVYALLRRVDSAKAKRFAMEYNLTIDSEHAE